MLFLLLIPVVTGVFNFEYMKVNFRNVEDEKNLFIFLGNETSMWLQTKGLIELTLQENETFAIYRSPLMQDVNFEYNNHGFFVNGNAMDFSYNQGVIISTPEPFQICYDFSTDKIIFETVIGFLVLCVLALTGKVNQDHLSAIIYKIRGYISKEDETKV